MGLCLSLGACTEDDDAEMEAGSTNDDSSMDNGDDTGDGPNIERPDDRLEVTDECNADPCCTQGSNYDPAMCDNPFGIDMGEDAGTAPPEMGDAGPDAG